ncbi:MAG: hypothetical protein O9345_20765 [Burkholderiaceae bacterium]|nr:hypothetical protein [Burkholderiaceae bacterium]
MSFACAAYSASPDLSRARQLVAQGEHQAADDLLLPFESSARAVAAFKLRLGDAALRTRRA